MYRVFLPKPGFCIEPTSAHALMRVHPKMICLSHNPVKVKLNHKPHEYEKPKPYR